LNLVFFTDRDLGRRFPDVLASAGLTVERHHDLFPPECPDEQWLQYVGENGRIAITHDRRIRYKPNELAAVRRHRVALLVVVGKVPLLQLAQNFVATMSKISAFLGQHEAPFIAKVYRPAPSEVAKDPGSTGSVSLWYPR
jgi:predicted nuclease of predicted toxin-antitoxin system